MKKQLLRLALLVVSIGMFVTVSFGQSTGNISGTVVDPKGAVVAGANVVVKNTATNQEFTTQTNEDGNFRVPAVLAGVYTATITAPGFKQTLVKDIKVDVGSTSTIPVALEVGVQGETVEVVGGGELIKTDNPTVGTTLTGRQITDIPTASRDALDLVLAMPGTATPGRPRTSTVNGLPKGALNITIDGLNVQDNLLKSSDGFFTYVRPRTDAIGEVTVSTSNPGAESSAEGAVQIKFVTQNGGNDYTGGVYYYHRNPALNTNYWFNNRDLPPDPVTGKAPQNRILLNQFGGKIGGPITIPGLFSGKDKAFFFVNYEEFRLPERTSRTKNILSPQAQAGNYRFYQTATYVPPTNVSCVPGTNPASPTTPAQLCTTNVLTLAGALNNAAVPGTADATIGSLLGSIRSSLSGAIIKDTGDPNVQQATFINSGIQIRKFPTVRFDFNVAKNHHIENIWNYQQFRSSVDFLNSVDPAFPGFPNFGSQDSNRFSNVTAWRWTITNSLVNEARFGLLGGTSLFFAQVNSGQFVNQGGYSLGLSGFTSGGFALSNATVTNAPSRRNSPVKQFTDNLNWVKGNHSFTFGTSITKINLFNQGLNAVPTITFGVSSTLDPVAFGAFTSLPTANQGVAAQLYATLSGRVSAVGANAYLDENTGKLVYQGNLISRASQTEYGIFGQDTWRVRPNLTINYGLRWEVQLPFTPLNNTYTISSFDGLFGESGLNNIFRPGTLTGSPTAFVPFKKGDKAYNTNYDNFAPSVGFSYSPNFENSFLKKVMGGSGQTVIRGGFAMAYIREGTNTFQSLIGANPGGTFSATRNISGSPYSLPVGTLYRNRPFAPPAFTDTLTFPYVGTTADSVNVFNPNIDIGYVESWTVGIQRELTSNMAIEARYVGNRGHKLWRQYNINEVNVFENGFLNEFKLAQQNLLANVACANTVGCTGGGLHFRYRGPGTGTNPLPYLLGYLTGQPVANPANAANPANYGSAFFANAVFVNPLNPMAPSPTQLAVNIGQTTNAAITEPNRIAAGIPINYFYANPGKRGGGAWIIDNGSQSWYDGFTFEFRRRLAKGLLVQSSYTFSKALGNTFASSSGVADQPNTLRDPGLRKGIVPFDITHGFKTNFIYELPFGRGKSFFGDSKGWVDKLVGGWGFNGNVRVQSGTPFSMGNVSLVGMTQKELQESVGVYRETDGFVYIFPKDIRENTFKAFSFGYAANGTPTFTQGTPTGRFIAPAAASNCLQGFAGGCGFANLVLKGPAFFRSDLSIVKKVRFTERMNLELRAEFLNAFNNINFLVGNAGNDVNTLGGQATTSFGRITNAYQDLSTTNDPGGRLVQLVVRFNF